MNTGETTMMRPFQLVRIGVTILLLMLLFGVPPVMAEDKLRQQRMQDSPVSKEGGNNLQFMGMIEPGERLGIILMPGEVVLELPVKEDEPVNKGDLVVQLSNDQLLNALIDLQQKEGTLQERKQQLQLLKLEIDLKEKSLEKITTSIAEEKKLQKTISGYSSTVVVQLESQQVQLDGQLAVLKAQYDMGLKNIANEKELTDRLNSQLSEIQRRIDALSIRVPFDGIVKYVAPDPHRTVPGELLCEIWNESYHRVRGTIIQHQFDLISPGDKVSVTVDFVSNREIPGVVLSVGQPFGKTVSQPGNLQRGEGYATFEVIIKVEEGKGLIQPGMMASILKKNKDNS